MDNDLVRLRHFIRDHHNLEEFRTLCFDLGVRYDVLGGEGLDAKTRELLLHLGRQRRFDDLLKALENTRPNPFRQAGFNSHSAAVKTLYAALPAFSGDEPPVTHVSHKRPLWQLALRVLAILSWVVAAIWFLVEPGFEPLLALLSGGAFFLGSFAVDKGEDAGSTQEAAARNRRISQALMEKVRAIWIQDVLENSLYNMARIELGLAKVHGAVERPWSIALERPGEEEKPLPPNTKIEVVFRQLNGAMLILGAPGSGKTVTLLTLASQLLDRAERNPTQPVPLVFNLSSWVHKRMPLAEWLVEELYLIYGVSKRYAPGWLQSAAYTLLLDGLDEVAEDHRDACVAAINQFHQENGFTHIAVCSRTGDYERLARQLNLMGAVAIRPLSREQVDDFLAAGGESLAAARVAVNADALLQELARTPLTLNVIALAYQGRRLDDLVSGTLEERRRHLFETYVQRMFERRGAVGKQEREQALHYLAWLAARMTERSQTVYYIEKMQPAWLGDRERLYRIATGLVVGIVVYLIFGLYSTVVVGRESFELELVFILSLVIYGGLANIRLVETFNWSWRKGITYFSVVLVAILVALLFFLDQLSYGLHLLFGDEVIGLISVLGLGLGFGLVGGLSYEEVKTRSSPNQGVWSSGRNALLVGLIFGLVFVGLVVAVLHGSDFVIVLLYAVLFLGLGSGLIFGGMTVIQHTILRLFLTLNNYLPLRLVDFLNEMSVRILLRKVGGGYMFVHRMLLEYFADADNRSENSITKRPI